MQGQRDKLTVIGLVLRVDDVPVHMQQRACAFDSTSDTALLLCRPPAEQNA